MKIKQVDLYISHFQETIYFYEHILGLRLKLWTEEMADFQIGDSMLRLIKDEKENHYYYHFAFNIPANKFKEAKSWLKEKVTLLTEDGEDEIEFDGSSQATSCYFEDPAGNIVELIARKKVAPHSDTREFTTRGILSISEISLTTDGIEAAYRQMQALGLSVRGENQIHLDTHLNFVGDQEDNAFILLGPIGRRWLFSEKQAIASPVVIHTDYGKLTQP